MVLAQTQTFYCYRCGHQREDHRKMVRISTRETIYVDCLRPVGERTSILKIKIVHVCQCSEYRTKEDTTEVNRPGE